MVYLAFNSLFANPIACFKPELIRVLIVHEVIAALARGKYPSVTFYLIAGAFTLKKTTATAADGPVQLLVDNLTLRNLQKHKSVLQYWLQLEVWTK